MSAYGAIHRQNQSVFPLPSTIWPTRNTNEHVVIYHLQLESARSFDGLIEYLSSVFAQEVEDGLTYPQEDMVTKDSFEAYFFAADLLLGIIVQGQTTGSEVAQVELDKRRAGRSWEECVVGCYYVKPNYPGRSSHICNGGFLVPLRHRGSGYGSVLAKSYVHYAPKLGYRASVFNLVFVTNVASIKLWERLQFTKAGLIPKAGRLKSKDGNGEVYVDAWVIYKSFVDDDVQTGPIA